MLPALPCRFFLLWHGGVFMHEDNLGFFTSGSSALLIDGTDSISGWVAAQLSPFGMKTSAVSNTCLWPHLYTHCHAGYAMATWNEVPKPLQRGREITWLYPVLLLCLPTRQTCNMSCLTEMWPTDGPSLAENCCTLSMVANCLGNMAPHAKFSPYESNWHNKIWCNHPIKYGNWLNKVADV